MSAERPRIVISAETSGHIAGALLIFGSIATFAAMFGRDPGDAVGPLDFLVAGGAALTGVMVWFLPWERWGQQSTLFLLPPVFALLAFGNYSDPDPYIAGLFFVVIGMWVGLCHRRYTTLALAPVIGVLYWWPLHIKPHLDTLNTSAFVVTAVAVMSGEVLSELRSRLDQSQQRVMAATERRFAALVRRSSDVSLVFDREGIIRYVSPAALTTFGYEPAALENRLVIDFLEEAVEGVEDGVLDALLAGSDDELLTNVLELRLRHPDGYWIDIESTAQDRTDDPDINGIVVHIRDIRERKALERDLVFQAYHDELTGLPNRVAFRTQIDETLREGRRCTVVFMDLDGFKSINDSAGHDHGDHLLRLVAQRLLRVVPVEKGVVARLGGDEFAVLLPGGADDATVIAEAMTETLREPFRLGLTQFAVSASAGIADSLGIGTAEELIRNADTAMYVSKGSGVQRVTTYEPEMRARLLERLDTEAKLRIALERHEFTVHYQPTIELATGHTYGAEALVRWNHPSLGQVPPAEFIGVAEDSGLIVPLGRWVLHTACQDAASWQHGPGAGRSVAVNVSPRQFQDPALVSDIAAALALTGLPARLLTVEVTESVLIADTDAAELRLRELRALGVKLALDDFGTGYSSLSYLQALPFDVLKIDKTFVAHATTRASDLSLIQTINRLGHDLGLRTLVEGVETRAQAELMTHMRCDYAQGYLFAKPMPITALLQAWVEETTSSHA